MNTKYLYLGLLPLMATSGMAATDSQIGRAHV